MFTTIAIFRTGISSLELLQSLIPKSFAQLYAFASITIYCSSILFIIYPQRFTDVTQDRVNEWSRPAIVGILSVGGAEEDVNFCRAIRMLLRLVVRTEIENESTC